MKQTSDRQTKETKQHAKLLTPSNAQKESTSCLKLSEKLRHSQKDCHEAVRKRNNSELKSSFGSLKSQNAVRSSDLMEFDRSNDREISNSDISTKKLKLINKDEEQKVHHRIQDDVLMQKPDSLKRPKRQFIFEEEEKKEVNTSTFPSINKEHMLLDLPKNDLITSDPDRSNSGLRSLITKPIDDSAQKRTEKQLLDTLMNGGVPTQKQPQQRPKKPNHHKIEDDVLMHKPDSLKRSYQEFFSIEEEKKVVNTLTFPSIKKEHLLLNPTTNNLTVSDVDQPNLGLHSLLTKPIDDSAQKRLEQQLLDTLTNGGVPIQKKSKRITKKLPNNGEKGRKERNECKESKANAMQSQAEKRECSICYCKYYFGFLILTYFFFLAEIISNVGQIDGCKHRFCFDCIVEWVKTKNTCPLCRARFNHIAKYSKNNVRLGKTRVESEQQAHTNQESIEVDDQSHEHFPYENAGRTTFTNDNIYNSDPHRIRLVRHQNPSERTFLEELFEQVEQSGQFERVHIEMRIRVDRSVPELNRTNGFSVNHPRRSTNNSSRSNVRNNSTRRSSNIRTRPSLARYIEE